MQRDAFIVIMVRLALANDWVCDVYNKSLVIVAFIIGLAYILGTMVIWDV